MQKLIPPKRIVESRIRARKLLVRARRSWIAFRNAVDRSVAERVDTSFRVCGELAEQSFLKEGEYARIVAIGREKRRELSIGERRRVDTKLFEAAAARDGDVSRLKESILNGADVNTRDSYDSTAGYWAVRNGHTECLKLLIDAELDVNAQNHHGWTVGHLAAERGRTECLRILVGAKLDVRIVSGAGRTAEDVARLRGNIECLRILKEAE